MYEDPLYRHTTHAPILLNCNYNSKRAPYSSIELRLTSIGSGETYPTSNTKTSPFLEEHATYISEVLKVSFPAEQRNRPIYSGSTSISKPKIDCSYTRMMTKVKNSSKPLNQLSAK